MLGALWVTLSVALSNGNRMARFKTPDFNERSAAARAAEEEANAPKPQKSAEELKALRDLRYAARKARKK